MSEYVTVARSASKRLSLDHWVSRQGSVLAGFSVRNSHGKVLAIGAQHMSRPGFCVMHAMRYEHDKTLVAAIERMTGFPVRSILKR